MNKNAGKIVRGVGKKLYDALTVGVTWWMIGSLMGCLLTMFVAPMAGVVCLVSFGLALMVLTMLTEG